MRREIDQMGAWPHLDTTVPRREGLNLGHVSIQDP